MQAQGSRLARSLRVIGVDQRGALRSDPLPILADLTQPALLLHGADDLTPPPEAIAAFRAAVPGGLIRTFGRSAHFAYLEEPDDYAAAVTGFMTDPPAR